MIRIPHRRSVPCSRCHEDNKIVAYNILKYEENLDVLLPICEKCVLELKREAA